MKELSFIEEKQDICEEYAFEKYHNQSFPKGVA